MFTCKVCGEKFKTMQALGGHVGRAHPRDEKENRPDTPSSPPANVEGTREAGKPEPAMTAGTPQSDGPKPEEIDEAETKSAGTGEPGPAGTDQGVEVVDPAPELGRRPDEGPGVMDCIRDLRRRGFSARQAKEHFGYPRSTVDQVFAEYIEPEDKPALEVKEGGLPVTIKGTEIITPEAIMQKLANGSQDWQLRLEGMMLLRAAQRMNRDDVETTRMQAEADATRIKPILELMKETRLEQDSAAQRAKESNIEIAERAAYDTAGQLSQVINQNNAKITESINQIRQAMGGKEDNPLGQMLNAMQSMQQMMQMFGVAMPGMGGAPGGGPQYQPPPITHSKRNETQEGGQ